MSLTYAAANTTVNNLVGRSTTGGPVNGVVYVGLSSTKPSAEGLNVVEPLPQYGYSRMLLANSSTVATIKMGSAEAGKSKNTEIVFFPEVVNASWGTINYLVFYTAATGGTPFMYGELSASIAPGPNTVPIIRVADLSVAMVVA